MVGRRCFFQTKHICCFGTVIKEEIDGRLLILGDDGMRYTAVPSDVVLLERRKYD